MNNLHGWFDFGEIYNEAVEHARDDSVLVEVGVAFGRSLAHLARRLIDSGKKSTLYGIDLWRQDDATWPTHPKFARSPGGFHAFCADMVQHAPEELERSSILRLSSLDAAKLVGQMGGADFVFIDAHHAYPSVRADIDAWLPIMRSGGVIAGHDHTEHHPGVIRAVRESFGDTYRVRGNSWWKQLP